MTFSHPKKALAPMATTPCAMAMRLFLMACGQRMAIPSDIRMPQWEEKMPSGRTLISSSQWQPSNAASSMLSMLLGKDKALSPSHSENAFGPIRKTPSGISTLSLFGLGKTRQSS